MVCLESVLWFVWRVSYGLFGECPVIDEIMAKTYCSLKKYNIKT